MQPNLGERPPHARGKRIMVKLRNGICPPESWAASGRDECNWAFTPEGRRSRDFDILFWELAR